MSSNGIDVQVEGEPTIVMRLSVEAAEAAYFSMHPLRVKDFTTVFPDTEHAYLLAKEVESRLGKAIDKIHPQR